MSYDLDQIHKQYGLQVSSVVFGTVSDVAGTTVIPGVAGQVAVIHNVLFLSSSYSKLIIERATGAASSYFTTFGGQMSTQEETRIVTDTGASVFADIASIAVTTGSGVIRLWWNYQKGGAATSL